MSIVVKRLDVSRCHLVWTMEERVGPDHIVLDGNPAPPQGAQQPPKFRPVSIVAKWLQDQNATCYGGRPQRRRHCVRWHVQIGKRFEPSTVLWAFHIIQLSSYICLRFGSSGWPCARYKCKYCVFYFMEVTFFSPVWSFVRMSFCQQDYFNGYKWIVRKFSNR